MISIKNKGLAGITANPIQRRDFKITRNLLTTFLFSSLFLSGCGGGGSSSDTTPTSALNSNATTTDVANDTTSTDTETGQLTIALTDAEGDFVSYTVDVLSITLQKANGTTVETVPLSTRVDFAQCTDMTEFLNITTVPAGIYTSAKMVLDYSNAEIIVQDENGNTYNSTAVNSLGETLTQLTVDVNLADKHALQITRGVPASLTLDFDLDSSNEITSFDPAIVTVEPVLIANTELVTDREHRARGVLNTVDLDNGTFTLNLKPFHHRSGIFGEMTFTSSEVTHYEINGMVFEGNDGIIAMAALEQNTPVIAQGSVTVNAESLADSTFNAQTVYAGSSVPWSNEDVVQGTVVARSNNSLTVRGHCTDSENHSVSFNDDITVNISDDTRFTAATESSDNLTTNSVSVGQQITAFGLTSGEGEDITLDATAGHLRLQMNVITGTVQSVEPLVLNLSRLNGRELNLFDFSGTGIDAENNADASAYEIDTSTLSLSTLEENAYIKVRGMINNFGAAPADFNAQTIIDMQEEKRPSSLQAKWSEGNSAEIFQEVSEAKIILNLTSAKYAVKGAGVRHHYHPEMDQITLYGMEDSKRPTTYVIKEKGEHAVIIYNSFADLTVGLTERINRGLSVSLIDADGCFDVEDATMKSAAIKVVFQ